MNIYFEIALIIAAAIIGRLWPRKPLIVEKIIEKTPEPTVTPGLYFPKDTCEIQFRNLTEYYIFKKDDYHSIFIKPSKNLKLKFRMSRDLTVKDPDITGRVEYSS